MNSAVLSDLRKSAQQRQQRVPGASEAERLPDVNRSSLYDRPRLFRYVLHKGLPSASCTSASGKQVDHAIIDMDSPSNDCKHPSDDISHDPNAGAVVIEQRTAGHGTGGAVWTAGLLTAAYLEWLNATSTRDGCLLGAVATAEKDLSASQSGVNHARISGATVDVSTPAANATAQCVTAHGVLPDGIQHTTVNCLSGLQILELGCGSGILGLVAARLGANVTLTDDNSVRSLAESNVDANRWGIRGAGGSATFEVCGQRYHVRFHPVQVSCVSIQFHFFVARGSY